VSATTGVSLGSLPLRDFRLIRGSTLGIRFYISTNEGLRRVATKALIEKEGVFPQFAGTRQKMVEVITQRRDGDLLFRASGVYADFDQDGRFYVSMSSMVTASRMVEAHGAIEKERLKSPDVRDLGLRRNWKDLKDKTRWEISAEEREAIAADLLGSDRPRGTRAIPLLKVEYP